MLDVVLGWISTKAQFAVGSNLNERSQGFGLLQSGVVKYSTGANFTMDSTFD